MSKLSILRKLVGYFSPHKRSELYFSKARKKLEKEVLTKDSYNRFIKSTEPFYRHRNSTFSKDVITNTLYQTKKRINTLNRALKKGKRYGPDDVLVKAKGTDGMLTKNLKLESQVKKYKGHTDSFIYNNKNYYTEGSLRFDLKDEIALYKRYLNKKQNMLPPSYNQYRTAVKNTLRNVPTAISRGQKGQRNWGGVYNPAGSVRSNLDPRSSGVDMDLVRRLTKLGKKSKGLKYGMVRVQPGNVAYNKMMEMPHSTGIHELKHALQYNIRKTPGGRPISADALDLYSRGFFKKNWKKEITEKGWHGYKISQVPIELSARASQLRALPAIELDLIMKNPKEWAKIYKEVKDIAKFTGYGHNFRNYLKSIWALPMAYFGAKGIEKE